MSDTLNEHLHQIGMALNVWSRHGAAKAIDSLSTVRAQIAEIGRAHGVLLTWAGERISSLEEAMRKIRAGHWEAEVTNSYERSYNRQWGEFACKSAAMSAAESSAIIDNDTASRPDAVFVFEMTGEDILKQIDAALSSTSSQSDCVFQMTGEEIRSRIAASLEPVEELPSADSASSTTARPRGLTPLAEVDPFFCVWRCSHCGDMNDQIHDTRWRWNSEAWEHACGGPQDGHYPARNFGPYVSEGSEEGATDTRPRQ